MHTDYQAPLRQERSGAFLCPSLMAFNSPIPTIAQATWSHWSISERIAQLAAYHADVLKVREQPVGSNRGPMVDHYLAVCGLQAQPWCAAFYMWLLINSGVPEKDLPPKGIRASTQQVAKWAKKNGKVVATPQRGDLFLHLNPDGATGHAGVYLGPGKSPSVFRSIEGNTNDEGEREGYEVCRKERAHSYVTVFVRFTA